MMSLTILQNKMKKNPESYRPEFRQQLRSFDAQLAIFELSPPKDSKEFGQLVMFLSHCSELYPVDSKHFGPAVMGLLEKSYEAMDPELRRTLYQGLVLMRNRGLVDAISLITLSFSLFRCRDKVLRELLYSHIVNDVRSVNKKATNLKLNKSIQNVVYKMLDEPDSIAAKKSLQVMVDLYKRRVWIDGRTVNVIAQACLSKQPKLVAISLQFFLGIDQKIDELMEEEEEDAIEESLEASTGKSRAKLERGNQKTSRFYAKKTKARLRKSEKESKALKKARTSQQSGSEDKRVAAPRWPAIELLNDPQGFSEQLFKKLRASGDHFEVRILMMNLISRVIGYHKLILLPFYSFLQKYMQPHQRYVTKILAFLLQSAHDLIPPEDLEPIVKHIANNFVNDRTGSEAMAVGLNCLRELFGKVPLITKGQGVDDLIQDLILYKNYRRDKSVVMAARSLLNSIREINPSVLQRKERGKFHNASDELGEYGQLKAAQGVDGAELLQYLEEEAKRLAKDGDDDEDDEELEGEGEGEEEEEEEDEEREGEEQKEEGEDEEEEGEDEELEEGEDEELEDGEEMEEGEGDGDPTTGKRKRSSEATEETLLEKLKKRKINQVDRIDAKRLLTEEDFERIRKLKAKLEKEKRDPRARRKTLKKIEQKKNSNFAVLKSLQKKGLDIKIGNEESDQEDSDPFGSDVSSDEEEEYNNDGAVDPRSLEGVIRRRRKALADRLALVHEGREGSHQLIDSRVGGTNNTEKLKNKNFMMVSKSDRIKRKQTASLRQQQNSLRRHIKNLERSKKTVQKVRRRGK